MSLTQTLNDLIVKLQPWKDIDLPDAAELERRIAAIPRAHSRRALILLAKGQRIDETDPAMWLVPPPTGLGAQAKKQRARAKINKDIERKRAQNNRPAPNVDPRKIPRDSEYTPQRGLLITTVPQDPCANLRALTHVPKRREVYYYRDPHVHSTLAHLPQKSAFLFSGRSDAKRKTLRPKIIPQGVRFDRTHIIPFGYHGSENDPRLVVGWDSAQNQGIMKRYEEHINALNRKRPVLWACTITRDHKIGATLRYDVFDPATRKRIVKPLEVTMNHPVKWLQ